MGEDQLRVMLTLTAREIIGCVRHACRRRQLERRPLSWLDTQLTDIERDAMTDLTEIVWLATQRTKRGTALMAPQEATRTYGENFTMQRVRRYVTNDEARIAMQRARSANAESPFEYEVYDDAITIYPREPRTVPFDEGGSVGTILLAPAPHCTDMLEIYALEVGEGYQRPDVERHIGLLFGPA